MKKILALVLLMAIVLVTGCGGGNKTPNDTTADGKDKPIGKILVVYFSRTGETHGNNITKGNTAIVADIIAQKTGGDIFEIKPVNPYPNEYEACVEVAKRELEVNARPEFVGNVENFAQYDMIFVGYPIWLSSVPRVVLTFLENNDFNGKKVVPFCTHGGSGLGSTPNEITRACRGAAILDGFDIIGTGVQQDKSQTESIVVKNLKRLDIDVAE
ncbi:MAG: flavodoxin [Selenomonadaceae bacterium]|nr:flavodoxin [Selenomonadaceae bacterium]